MAAESKARQKSLNGWRKREGGFNYRKANRQATLSIVPLPAFSRSATLSFKQRKILQHLLFVLYLLRLLNKTARRAVGFGRWRNTNNRPLPRSHSPPLKGAISTGRAARIFSALPGVVVFITILLFSSTHIAHAQNASFISAEDFKRPAVSYEQLFPPAQEQKADESSYTLAMAPQDSGRGSGFSGWMNDLDKVINGDPNSLEWQNAVQRLGQNEYFKPTLHEIEAGSRLDEVEPGDKYYWIKEYILKGNGSGLESKLNSVPPPARKNVSKFLTAQKQLFLKDLGYYSGALDSIAGPMTGRAWSAFERDSRSENWRTRYALALKFFEAGKRTGRIDYYNQTVEHLFWIAQTYSILLPTKVRNEMYDFLTDMIGGYILNSNDERRKLMEKRIGALAWYGRDSPVEAKKWLIKTLQTQIYLFPNRGPPRTGLRILHAEDQVPRMDMSQIKSGWSDIIEYGDKKEREEMYRKLFPERSNTQTTF